MCEDIRKFNAHLTECLVKTKDLSDNLNELRHGSGQKLARVTRAVGVADALDQPFYALPLNNQAHFIFLSFS